MDGAVHGDEVVTVVQMVSFPRIHACNLGVPILAEELEAQRTRHTDS
ncbi:hypothetical protein [Rhodococcus sp. B50]|nr:hypothetical protein [Rhodococcus sp. B50]